MSAGSSVTRLAGGLAVSALGALMPAERSRRRRAVVALTHSTIALLASAIVGLSPNNASAISFTGLGDLAGGRFSSVAYGVSADGSTVVGYSFGASGAEAFRWTSGGGMVGLGDLGGGGFLSLATGVSADGSTIVGRGTSASGTEAFRWTSSSGMVGLGDLPGGGSNSSASGVSADGSTIVGYGSGTSGTEAFRWTLGGGMVGLGDLAGGAFDSYALGASADGSTIVGYGKREFGNEAFRWTAGGGMVGLGDVAGGLFASRASGVSADGSTIVGQGDGSTSRLEAVIWTARDGMKELDVVLSALGVDVSGWVLSDAYGISADGKTIVGWGTNPSGFQEAWIAVIPEPGTGALAAVGLAALALRPRRSRPRRAH